MNSDCENGVRFAEGVTISNIASAHEIIVSLLECDGDATIDVSSLSETDLTFVQLIEAARHTAADRGRTLRLHAPAQGALLQVLQRGGFLDPEDQERSDFWLQGTIAQ